MIRSVQDHAEGRPDHAMLAWLDHLADAAQEEDPRGLMAITDALPPASVSLLERSASLQSRIVEALRLRRADDERSRADFATALNNLANRLSQLAQREAALDAAREAVSIYRELAASRADAFRP